MKKIVSFFVALCFLGAMIVPLRADALVPPMMPFGGWPSIFYPCTCSFSLWVWFTPLYLTSIPLTGPLVYTPYATLPYPNFLVSIPGIPHLGAYIPGVQACWMYVGVACIPLPSIGVMGFVGTGL